MARVLATAIITSRPVDRRSAIIKAIAFVALPAWVLHQSSAFTGVYCAAARSAPLQRGSLLKRQAGICQVPGDVKRGLKIMIDDTPYEIMEFQSKKVGKGIAITKAKVKNVMTSAIMDKTLNSGAKYETCETEVKEATYSYFDGDTNKFIFMDSETFETVELSADTIGQAGDFLSDGLTVDIEFFQGTPLNLRFKENLVVEIIEVSKNSGSDRDGKQIHIVTLENGLRKPGPGYLKVGDKVIINKESFNMEKRV